MKKVRYAIGALGVAPALGLMMPTTTTATHALQSSGRPATKTVSLKPVIAAAGCTGHLPASKTTSSGSHIQSIKYWYTLNTPVAGSLCIGTVEGDWVGLFGYLNYKIVQHTYQSGISVSHHSKIQFSPKVAFGVHLQDFAPNATKVQECLHWYGAATVDIGHVCKNVP
jgi:hypothetical protein